MIRLATIELTTICDICSKFQRSTGTTFAPAYIPTGWIEISIFNPNGGEKKEGHVCNDCQLRTLKDIMESMR